MFNNPNSPQDSIDSDYLANLGAQEADSRHILNSDFDGGDAAVSSNLDSHRESPSFDVEPGQNHRLAMTFQSLHHHGHPPSFQLSELKHGKYQQHKTEQQLIEDLVERLDLKGPTKMNVQSNYFKVRFYTLPHI